MTPDRWPDRVHPNGQPWLATPRPGEGRAHPRGSSDRGAAGLVGTGAPLSRADLRELVLAIPAAVVILLGLWAFCALLFALAPVPR